MPAIDKEKKKELAESIWGDVTKDSERRASPPQDRENPLVVKAVEKKEDEVKFDLSDEEIEEAKKEFTVPTDLEVEKKETEDPPEDAEDLDTKTKPGQLKALRTQRDEARDELKKAHEEIENLKNKAPEIPEDLKESVGEKTIPEIIQENLSLKERLGEFEAEKDGLKSKLREVSIENDPDYISNYVAPIEEALDGFDAVIAEVDIDGNIVNPEYIQKLKSKLFNFKNGAPVSNAREAKAVLVAFADEYRNVTGEDYDMPSPSDVMKGIRTLSSLSNKRIEAKAEWEREREDAQASSLKNQQRKQEERQEILRKERIKNTEEAIDQFDYKKYSELGSPKEIKDMVLSASGDLEKMITDPSSQPSWKEMIELRFRANNFDKLLELYLEGGAEDPDESHHGTSSKIDVTKETKSDNDVDWLGAITPKPINR